MWELDKSSHQRISLRIAKTVMEIDGVPGDRPWNPARHKGLMVALKEGWFLGSIWAIVRIGKQGSTFHWGDVADNPAAFAGKCFRVNGKHTSRAIVTMFEENPDWEPTFEMTIKYYRCDTAEDAAKLYSTFDTRMSSRTQKDINATFALTSEDLMDIPSGIRDRIVHGIALATRGQGYTATPQDVRAKAILDHVSFALFANRMISHKEGKLFLRGPVVAAMFLTWQKDPEAAEEFWAAVRDGTDPHPKTPSRILQVFLLTKSLRSPDGLDKTIKNSRLVSAQELMVRCLHAWNAWRRDRPTNLKYYGAAGVPDVF